MEIYKDKYIQYIYEEKNSLISFYWSKDTENMSEEMYKKLMLKGIEFVETYKPKFVMNYAKDKTFITTINLQEWVATNALSKLFENGVIKFAVVESEDFIIQLSTKQAVDEDTTKKYQTMFFDSEEKARKWFFKK